MAESAVTLGSRARRQYYLKEKLGEGAMGVVYRAVHRMSGQAVALKVLHQRDRQPERMASTPLLTARASLISEFRTLSTLHHPNIVKVTDYGFDPDYGPYLALELIEEADPLLPAAQDIDVSTQVSLLAQVLRALVYLHRRGIVHRDLKPSNVLLSRGTVKVVDFGIATRSNQEANVAGTPAYMAPELWLGVTPSVSSDLYALGVMAYEMLTGQRPHQHRLDELRVAVATAMTEVDTLSTFRSLVPPQSWRVSPFGLEELRDGAGIDDAAECARPLSASVRWLLAQLLSWDPSARPTDAGSVLRDLSLAYNLEIPLETENTRESFLQSWEMVGRDDQLDMLRDALSSLIDRGQGSGWLIGGESGIGKSRLTSELRTLALVSGATVVDAQAELEGGGLRQLWSGAIGRLCLQCELDDDKLSVLKALMPELPQLLGRELPDPPPASPVVARARLLDAVEVLLRRQTGAVVLLVEDLQWAREDSLAVVARLCALCAERPLLIVCNYRDDEAPDVPRSLPAAMQKIKLERLARSHVEQLCRSMLASSASTPGLVDYLFAETEGNVFFLVEVLRALAQRTGGLQRVGEASLQEHVLTGGIQQIVLRRVERVGPFDRPILEVAALLGRAVDLPVLRLATNRTSLDAFLWRSSEAALLEEVGGQWRFTHDKIREALVGDLSPDKRIALHADLARALEEVYQGSEREAKSALLALHFQQAGRPQQACAYWAAAGDLATRLCSYADAAAFYGHALELLPTLGATASCRRQEVDILLKQVFIRFVADDAQTNLARMERARAALAEATGEAMVEGDDELRLARINFALGRVHFYRGEIREALRYYEQVLPLAQRSNDDQLLALPSVLVGTALFAQGEMRRAEPLLSRAIEPVERLGDPFEWFRAVGYHGVSLLALGRCQEGMSELQRVLDRAREVGQPNLASAAHLMTGSGHLFSGDWERVIEHLTVVTSLAQQTGDNLHLSLAWSGIGWAQGHLGAQEQARECRRRGREISQAMGGSLMLEDWYQAADAEIALIDGELEEALTLAVALVDKARSAGLLFSQGVALRVWGEVLARRGRSDEGDVLMSQSVEVLERGGMFMHAARSRFQWALQRRARGEADAAAAIYAQVRGELTRCGYAFALAEMSQAWG